ncbi:hypothetical protein [Mesorhizobium sp. M2E.F.Ca.ET.219.01.1.1]|jgi:hypothetical protein|uniref:hypothetical protein n=1 Tax=Mesorhizobium sp. M2E.F.Ca.ET.219.01.1.1 TaxID=2500530 RepID=UPI000FDC66DD|nr:hypothetical protein [Mesorhizobium sp. M2E.F.Ca.ET.219.01.1.1]TGQ05682.1 hypothetical protein EN862_030010 [Mesorhizobium sp. M2E.F.Ca.ET.219.01.1.1]
MVIRSAVAIEYLDRGERREEIAPPGRMDRSETSLPQARECVGATVSDSFRRIDRNQILRVEILHMWRNQALKVTPLNEKRRREACRHLQC